MGLGVVACQIPDGQRIADQRLRETHRSQSPHYLADPCFIQHTVAPHISSWYEKDAMDVLARVGRRKWKNEDKNSCTVHSVVFNLSKKTMMWIPNEHYNDEKYLFKFSFDSNSNSNN